jgi:NADH dehydrogenase FAD-containing subunit
MKTHAARSGAASAFVCRAFAKQNRRDGGILTLVRPLLGRPPMKNGTNGKPLPRVVVLGGGFGGLEAAFYLRKRIGKRAQVTVISPSDRFLFKPNTIYIPFGKPAEELLFPLRPAFERRRIDFVQGAATSVDPVAKRVRTGTGDDVPYDHLVIATGAAMRASEIPGLAENANTIWTPEEMQRLGGSIDSLVEWTKSGGKSRVLFLVPPNNKCAGPLYELVLMLDTWLRRRGARQNVQIRYATYERTFIQAFGPRLHDVVSKEFADRGITGTTNAVVRAVEPKRVVFADGSDDAFDLLVSFPPYVAAQRFDSLPSDDRGFIRVDPQTRQVNDFPDVYVVGDAGDFPVKQAFLALLQADAVGEHIAERVLGDEPTAAFDPVSMCIMEQFDKATFAQVPLRLTGDPSLPVVVREDALDKYRVGSGAVWRLGKKMLGAAIPERFGAGRPFHAGATWAVMDAGLKVMEAAFTD